MSRDLSVLRKTRTDRINAKTDADGLEAWSAAAILMSMRSRPAPWTARSKRGGPAHHRLVSAQVATAVDQSSPPSWRIRRPSTSQGSAM